MAIIRSEQFMIDGKMVLVDFYSDNCVGVFPKDLDYTTKRRARHLAEVHVEKEKENLQRRK